MLKTIEKTQLYSTEPGYSNEASMDHRNYNRAGLATTGMTNAQITTLKANYAKDLNIDDRITKFSKQLQNEHVYRIPLRYFSDIGKIRHSTKIDYRINLFFETDMKKLFESKSVLAARTAISAPDVQIIFTKVPYIQCEQILLDKNFRQYLEMIMVSKKMLKMGGTQKTSMQKMYEIGTSQDSIDVEFLGQIGNFIGSKYFQFTIKATIIWQFTTATIEKWLPKKTNPYV